MGRIDTGGTGCSRSTAALALMGTLRASGSIDEVACDAATFLGGSVESGSSDTGSAFGGILGDADIAVEC